MTDTDDRTPAELLHDLTDGHRVVMHVSQQAGALDARPLTVIAHEPTGTFRFLVDRTTPWVADGPALLAFDDEKHGRWVSARGRQVVVTDRATVERLWSPVAKAWFEGPDDPALAVLDVQVDEFSWWDAASNRLVRVARLVAAAVTGPEAGPSEGDHGTERL